MIELILVTGIIGTLATTTVYTLRGTFKKTAVSSAVSTQREITQAVSMYYLDMGFYPPDVNRGWDPGFAKALPWNPDEAMGEPPPGGYATSGVVCAHCPTDWQQVVTENWGGPYISKWPRFTPWKGKYDYNYWASGATRSGCTVIPGVYIGIQGDYNGQNTIPLEAEEDMITKGADSEKCVNGESQMILKPL